MVRQQRVLDVGNCGPDHQAICAMFAEKFPHVEVLQADSSDDALRLLRESSFDLVLINRKLDVDYSDGVEILKLIKSDPSIADTPVMLVTNYEEHQQAAVELGAVTGFGKLALNSAATHERLSSVLENAG